ncbi:MAG TPA: hypothetical protein VFS43_17710 [Polyangiaceae bacterium]|nr:hypothetical protein [Polyangiaceae bacterium]
MLVSTPPREAGAYSYGTGVFGQPCHEGITWRALRQVRGEFATAAPPAETDRDRALGNDLPFNAPGDMRDRAAAALLLGVRDNDLKGEGGRSAAELTFVHGDPDLQPEHCLRRPEHDEPGGSEAALADCLGFIRGRVLEALDGLGDSGEVDYGRTTRLKVTLGVRGKVELDLPLYFVRMGQALHAVQDGFSHTLRTPDGLRVTSVMNFVDEVEGRREGPRDGPPHMSGMDDCEADDALRAERAALAERATVDLLRATLDPASTRPRKEAAVEAVLATYFAYEPGCDAGNGWCDAPELETEPYRGCSCRAAAVPGGVAGWAVGPLAVAGLALARRRAARGAARGACAGALALVAAPSGARAQGVGGAAPVGGSDVPVERAGVYGHVAFGASYDSAALAGVGSGLVRLNKGWLVGLGGEWNPYINPYTGSVREGSINAFGTVVRRYRLRSETVNLRTTLNLGAAVLLTDLVGAPAGSVGPYVGVSALGLEWKVARGFYVIFDPTYIALPMPSPRGAAFTYLQYRVQLGIQFGG